MTEINEILVEEEVVEEIVEVPDVEYEKFLSSKQAESLEKAKLNTKHALRQASDEELIKLDGVGPATIIKLREWAVGVVPKGDAISLRTLIFSDEDGKPVEIKPGDIISAELGAAKQVKKGKAKWQ